ncbi:hypothetical protein CQW23_21353 [Capsicum baccatum]|uniref:KIB1-4 beta-propeller domain-containing protein n=1 Tax=Capsicum baccatum TaxID=33114 RepID=A0A2G2VXS3_CAPBA|nr:hypothetical protein CQW23_21353 [Capsicum baccatum]
MALANWAELPKDLIDLIAKCVKLIEDFIAFGVVCTSWRNSETKVNFDFLSPQLPLLMLADKGDDYREFYSLSKKKVSHVFLPEVRERECYPTEGWICNVKFDTTEMTLLHPFSRISIQLLLKKELWASAERFPERRTRYQCMSIAVLSMSPSFTSDYVLTISYYAYNFLACWRPGDLNWTYVDLDHHGGVSSMIYHKGQFYCVTNSGQIWVFGVPGPSIPQPIVVKATKVVHIANTIFGNYGYLIELSGALLIIFRYRRLAGGDTFRVFEIDVNEVELKKINTLGDYAIFVGLNGALCIDSSNFTEVKSNHIYFTDNDEEVFHCGDGAGRNMGAYNLEDRKTESFYPEESLSRSGICPPTWVTPSF